MSAQDHPMTYADQAVNITPNSALRTSQQSLTCAYQAWCRITNLNPMGIGEYFAGGWLGEVQKGSAGLAYKTEQGTSFYRVVMLTHDDFHAHAEEHLDEEPQGDFLDYVRRNLPSRLGLGVGNPGDWFVVRGTVRNIPQQDFPKMTRWLRRNMSNAMKKAPTFGYFEPDAYIGPFLDFEDADDAAKFWQNEDRQDVATYELSYDPVDLQLAIDRSYAAMM